MARVVGGSVCSFEHSVSAPLSGMEVLCASSEPPASVCSRAWKGQEEAWRARRRPTCGLSATLLWMLLRGEQGGLLTCLCHPRGPDFRDHQEKLPHCPSDAHRGGAFQGGRQVNEGTALGMELAPYQRTPPSSLPSAPREDTARPCDLEEPPPTGRHPDPSLPAARTVSNRFPPWTSLCLRGWSWQPNGRSRAGSLAHGPACTL